MGTSYLFRSIVAVEIDPGIEVLHADKPPAMARRVEVRLPAIKAAAAHHGHSRAQGPEVPFDPVAEGVVLEVHPRQEGAAIGGAFFYPDELIFVVVAVRPGLERGAFGTRPANPVLPAMVTSRAGGCNHGTTGVVGCGEGAVLARAGARVAAADRYDAPRGCQAPRG